MGKIELLAPAGSFEKAKIAFMYGADAVYCGTPKLSLRSRSELKDNDLAKTIEYTHSIGKKVFVAINIYAWDETYEEIKMYIELQGGYIFDFLDRFENLEQKLEIKGTVVNYDTFFDEEQYLFCTRTSFEIGGFNYKVEFFLEDQEQWCSYLEEIL